jgi:hypothetical protein
MTRDLERKGRTKRFTPVVPPTTKPVDYTKWVIEIEAGDTKWSSADTDESKMPHCKVGAWDLDRLITIR